MQITLWCADEEEGEGEEEDSVVYSKLERTAYIIPIRA